jgi:ankyrin repeat protein
VSARFKAAVAAIDAGDCDELRRLLEASSGLIHARAPSEGCPYDGYFRRATLLHHCAGNPARGGVPENIVEVARTLLECGAEVDAATEFRKGWNWTTLGLVASSGPAAEQGFAEPMIDLLLEHGADIDWGDGINLYAAFFHTVECAGLREVATMLHRRGATLDLGYAAAVGDLDAMRRFLADPPSAYTRYRPPANRFDKPSRRDVLDEALVFAAINTRIQAVDLLLDHGATLDGTAPIHGERPTAMHGAAWSGSLEMVRHLLEAGADPRDRDAVHSSTVFGWADYLGHHELRDWLLVDENRLDLRDAVLFGRLRRTTELGRGIDVDEAIGGGDPGVLLREAAFHGHAGIVRFLLDRGADATLANSEGQTALEYARRKGHDAIVKILEGASAD